MKRFFKKKLVIIGTGGHAHSVYDSADEYDVVGFVDENGTSEFLGKPVYCSVDAVPGKDKVYFHIGIGDCKAREKFYEICKNENVKLATIVHKSAIVSKFSRIGDGNFIGRLAVIGTDVEIGENNIINSKALVEHGSRIGSNCNISTNAILNGDEVIGNGCFVGSNSVCKGQIVVGEHSVIGCGSICVDDVEPFSVVVGCPAKKIKENLNE